MTNLLTLLSLWALALVSLALGAEPVPRATFTEVTNYGTNPTGTRMWLYVPNNLAAKPAVVVGIHWCSGSAQAYYQGSQWARYSETYGFVVVYPQTPYTRDNCWDVASKMTLTHGGGGASNSIANMVDFVATQYGADRSRVFATGISSGAMMTVCCPGEGKKRRAWNCRHILTAHRTSWQRRTRTSSRRASPTRASPRAAS